MRLWTLHPCYLDPQGLVALWREALLAQAVLAGRTQGYRHHPQLQRFAAHPDALAAVNAYLREVLAESQRRGYRFDAAKLPLVHGPVLLIAASTGQRDHEWRHLRAKLAARSASWNGRWDAVDLPRLHPLFRLEPGVVADWERL